jgi:sortase A
LLRSGEISGRALILAARRRWNLPDPFPPATFPVAASAGVTAPAPPWERYDRRSQLARGLRILSLSSAVAGTVVAADVAVTLSWQEPLSALVASRHQEALDDELDELAKATPNPGPKLARAVRREEFARFAAQAARATGTGDPVGRIDIPTIGSEFAVVQGVDSGSLQKGPGHFPGTAFPGQGKTVAIAGHRTTYLAPFRHLDDLRPGDPIYMRMPYGKVSYRVEKSRIVDPDDYWVTQQVGHERLVLTACEPLFSDAQRIVVFARRTALTT